MITEPKESPHVTQQKSRVVDIEQRQKNQAAIAQVFIGSLVSYVVAQEIFYGKETVPLSRDRLIDSLMALMLGQRRIINSM